MASSQLPRSILFALGIAACPKPRKDTAPCLSPPPPPPPPEESEDTGAEPETTVCLNYYVPPPDTGELGPCLKMIAPSEDTGDVGPCLEYAIPPEPEDPPEEEEGSEEKPEGASLRGDGRARGLAAATRSVLERGVLPEDVAALLRDRRGDRGPC